MGVNWNQTQNLKMKFMKVFKNLFLFLNLAKNPTLWFKKCANHYRFVWCTKLSWVELVMEYLEFVMWHYEQPSVRISLSDLRVSQGLEV